VDVYAVIFKDIITVINMFVGEWPKLQMWQSDWEKKGSSRNIMTNYYVCVQQPHPEC